MALRLNRRGARALFLMSWAIYFCSYLGRLNYSSVMSAMIGDTLTKAQAGWVNTAFLIAYASGQLVNGLLAEKISPRRMAALGAIGGGIMNIAFCLSDSYAAMLALRLLTGLCMATLWPAILQAMVEWMNERDKIASSVNLASSMAAGTLVSYALCAGLLKWLNWRAAFWLPGALLVTMGAVWYCAYPLITKQTIETPVEAKSIEPSGESLPLKKLICVPVLIAAVLPVILHGAIKDGVTAWVPAYVSEVFGRSASFSALVSALLPLVNLSGAYLAQAVYEKTGRNTLRASAIFFFVATLMLAAMLTVARGSLALTMLCFAVITSAMMAVNMLLITLLPLYFERYGRAATVSGALNAVAYGGSALTSGLIGVLSSACGWNAAVLSWLGMMVAACVLCVIFRKTAEP